MLRIEKIGFWYTASKHYNPFSIPSMTSTYTQQCREKYCFLDPNKFSYIWTDKAVRLQTHHITHTYTHTTACTFLKNPVSQADSCWAVLISVPPETPAHSRNSNSCVSACACACESDRKDDKCFKTSLTNYTVFARQNKASVQHQLCRVFATCHRKAHCWLCI